jgi:hypothetical protein
MFRRIMLTFVVALATSGLASAGGFIGGYLGYGGGVGGGGYQGGSYYNSYYHYSAPSYNYAPAPQITYQRVPVYVIRKKPAPVKTVRVIHVHHYQPAPPACGCDTITPAPAQ